MGKKQRRLPGVAVTKLPEVSKAADNLHDWITATKDLKDRLKEAKELLVEQMKKAGISYYRACGLEFRLEATEKLIVKEDETATDEA